MSLLSLLDEKLGPPLRKKVGDYLMANDEDLARLQGLNPDKLPEKDTPWERALYKLLRSWTSASTDGHAHNLDKLRSDLQQLKSEFPDLMKPQGSQPVYRLAHIHTKSVKKTLSSKKVSKQVQLAGQSWLSVGMYNYKPHRPVQSWTINPRVLQNFINVDVRDAIRVVYIGKPTSEFIFNPNTIDVLSQNPGEYETLRFAGEGKFQALLNSEDLIDLKLLHHLPQFKKRFDEQYLRVRDYTDAWENPKIRSWDGVDFDDEFAESLYRDTAKQALRSLK